MRIARDSMPSACRKSATSPPADWYSCRCRLPNRVGAVQQELRDMEELYDVYSQPSMLRLRFAKHVTQQRELKAFVRQVRCTGNAPFNRRLLFARASHPLFSQLSFNATAAWS